MIGIGLMVFLLGVLIVVFDNSDVAKMALAAAQASPIVRQQLGEPIERGFFTSGTMRISGSTGQADLAIPISGPKGKATVYVVAQKTAGLWKLEALQVSFNGSRIDLLREWAASSQP